MTDKSQRPETTSPISGASHPKKKSNVNASITTDRSANARVKFIQLLKAYLYQEKGNQIYDQVMMDMGQLFYDQLKSGSLTHSIEVPFTLDIDLMHLTHYNQFVAENFIRCIFRYYGHLADYVKDIFQIKVENEENLSFEESEMLQKSWENFSVKVNLKLTNLPTAIDQVDPIVLLSDSLLREYGQLVQVKLARVVSVFEPSSYLYKTVKRRACNCEIKHQGTTITEVNSNMLKIFKNQVNYSTKMGKSLYYDVCEEN